MLPASGKLVLVMMEVMEVPESTFLTCAGNAFAVVVPMSEDTEVDTR